MANPQRRKPRTGSKAGKTARKTAARKKAAAKKKLPRKKGMTVREFQAALRKVETSLAYLLTQLRAVDDDYVVAPTEEGGLVSPVSQRLIGIDCGFGDGCPQHIIGVDCIALDKPVPGTCPQFVVGDECVPKPEFLPTGGAPITAGALKKCVERAAIATYVAEALTRGADPTKKIGK